MKTDKKKTPDFAESVIVFMSVYFDRFPEDVVSVSVFVDICYFSFVIFNTAVGLEECLATADCWCTRHQTGRALKLL
jgi:hypothetical protein